MNKINRILYICINVSVIILSGCNDEKSEIPTFLSLKSPVIQSVPGTGSSKQNIEDYWLYVGNDLLGVFSPGQLAPAIGSGIKDIAIQPGIRKNGIRDNASIYPFLDPFRSEINLCACGEILEVQPVFKYKPTAKFSFIEDFESNNTFIEDLDNNPITTSTIQIDTVFEGNFSLVLNADAVNRINLITTSLFYNDFASDGRDVFLEFNYKSNIPFGVGLQANINGEKGEQIEYGIYSSQIWKKMYISLTDLILASKANNGYRVIFQLIHPGPSFPEVGKLYLDNIKLVHY